MELREGYKNTELGVIPEDWDVMNLIEACTLKARIGWQGLTTAEYLETGDYGLVTGTDFKNGYIDWDYCVYVEKDRYLQDKNIQLKINDVLVTKDGTIGKVAFIDKLPNPTTLNSGVFVIRPKSENVDNQFFYYLLMSFYFDDFLSKITAGSTITHLYQKDFSTFNFILPTKTEQTAIATALSDADALINSLEKLIVKKRYIKQGAMQKLLKPKEGWEHKSLGEIGLISGAGVDKLINEDEVPVRLVNYMDVFKRDFIYSNELNHWVTAPQHKAIKCAVKQGDVFFTPSSEMRYDIAVSAVAMEDISNAVYSYHLVRLRLSEDWDLNFRTYIFKTRYFLGQAEQVCEGSGKRYVITLPKFRSLKVYYPKTKEEQNEIATILSDMDTEIQELETKLEKYRKIKLGMMQNLLTGKIRLV